MTESVPTPAAVTMTPVQASAIARSGRVVAVFGATAGMVQQTIRRYARDGARLVLVGRDGAKVEAVAADARVRGATNVTAVIADLDAVDALPALCARIWQEQGALDIVLLAHGFLPDQDAAQTSTTLTQAAILTNFTSPVVILTDLADRMAARGAGTIAVISSVAGVRGRQSNYVYGSTKAGLSAFTDGLRNRLFHRGVHVVTILPGFVDTPMTAHVKKNPLFASAHDAGDAVYRAIERRANIAYVPKFWWLIMTLVRMIPDFIFKRMKM